MRRHTSLSIQAYAGMTITGTVGKSILHFLLLVFGASVSGQNVTLENSHLALNIDTNLGAIISIRDKDVDDTYEIRGISFALDTDRGRLQALTPASVNLTDHTLTFGFETGDFIINLHYRLGLDDRFIEKWFDLAVRDALPCLIKRVTLESGTLGPKFRQIHFHDDNTIWQCPINLFLRADNGGCFAGIDYPYWEMSVEKAHRFTLGFAPNLQLAGVRTFVSEKYFLGVFRREGIHRYSQGPYPGAVPAPYLNWSNTGLSQHFKDGVIPPAAVTPEVLDWGEVWAMQDFMRHILPDDLPLPEAGFWIWQNGWWAGLWNPDTAVLDFLKQADIHDVMTANTWYGRGSHPYSPAYLTQMRIEPMGFPQDGGGYTPGFLAPTAFDMFHQYGQAIGVHVNSFSMPGILFDQKPAWASIDASGKVSQYLFGQEISCPAVDAYMDHMLNVLDNVFTKYKPRWWGFDGRWLSYWEVPYFRPGPAGLGFDTCHATDHGHPAGDNLYKEWKNIHGLLRELRRRHPGMCLETYYGLHRGGPWALGQFNGAYPFYETGGILMNRYQGWHLQNGRFNPVYKNTCDLFDTDLSGFKLNVISAISMASYCMIGPAYGGLGLQANRSFLAQWRAWATTNHRYLKVKRDLFGCPGFHRLDGSSHIIGDRGFLFLFPVGSGPTPRGLVPLNRWIGLDEAPAALYRITELFPQAGRLIGTYRYGDKFPCDIPPGSPVVLSLEPAPPGAQPEQNVPLLDAGQVITIEAFTSLGDPVTDVVGLAQMDAEAALAADGYTAGTIGTAYSETVGTGAVVSQNPAAFTIAAAGSRVDLVVSLGNVRTTVPDVLGLDQAAAEEDIVAENLIVAVSRSFSDTVPAGIVITQNPAGGTDVLAGSSVEIKVSRGIAPTIVTTGDRNGADASVLGETSAGDTNYGRDGLLNAQDYTAQSSWLTFIRFEIPRVRGKISSATLTLTRASTYNTGGYYIHGLTDSQHADNWSEAAITYKNAPGLRFVGVGSADVDPAGTTLLGTGSASTGTQRFSGAALDSFLNADTDGLVTFILAADAVGNAVQWFSKEGAPLAAPTLEFTVAPPAPLMLRVRDNGVNLDFEWSTRSGMHYDLLTSTDFTTPVNTWPVYADGVRTFGNIPATGPTNTLNGVLKVGPRRFFGLREEPSP